TNSGVYEPASINNAKQRAAVVEWLNNILPDGNLPINSSDEELRAFLIDGTVLCKILNKLKPGSVSEIVGHLDSTQSSSENVSRFLSAMDEIRLPRFHAADLKKGSMKLVLDCLLTLKTHFTLIDERDNVNGAMPSSKIYGEEKQKMVLNSKLQHIINVPVTGILQSYPVNHIGQKSHQVFQLKKRAPADLSFPKIFDMLKTNSFNNAPTQSLLSVINGILDESINRKNGEITHRVACLLRKVVQEIERRICTQMEHLRLQSTLFKSREEKYQSRIKVLEALLATGTSEETNSEKSIIKEINKEEKIHEQRLMKEKEHDIERVFKEKEEDLQRVVEEKEKLNNEVVKLRQELDVTKQAYEQQILKSKEDDVQILVQEKENDIERVIKEKVEDLQRVMEEKDKLNAEVVKLRQELDVTKQQDVEILTKEKDELNSQIVNLRQEVEVSKQTCEQQTLKIKEERGAKQELEVHLKDTLSLLTESKNRIKELEAASELKSQWWSKKQHIFQIFMEFQLGALRELRFTSQSIQQDLLKTKKSYSEEFNVLGSRIQVLDESAKGYYKLLSENQKIHNELQELKGNIRVYCRIRPFHPGQKSKQSIVEYIGENGELIIMNPSKPGKEGRRSFKFNKVYGPPATQAEVFADTKPLVQSVLDGYNICIFAYGQTGSGKTYTMMGPDGGTEDEWGVNYRALNNLFRISQSREGTFTYEISVQMVEIYNEQVRDLLSNDDASIHAVSSTSHVLDLINIGQNNRAKSSTAMNERSSRSHSVLSIHVRGTDLKSSSSLRGSLHLVDLAGSERVDRSEVTGDRLKEAQHINKSLSALGDVIFALAQKSSHVPYRNSKLTQVLQTSLGGQAKTLMFVQINPDGASYSESLSALKFAERVSGVELGAAKSSKDGKDVRELMEQVASLKDTIARKDEEIETLQLMRD
ncbi:hypothetical protein M569_11869, partial [Genlisea aurea]